MEHKHLTHVVENNQEMGEEILTSLAHLHNTATVELKPIIKLALHLCEQLVKSTSIKAPSADTNASNSRHITALEYMKKQAALNKLVEIESVLDATIKLCVAIEAVNGKMVSQH